MAAGADARQEVSSRDRRAAAERMFAHRTAPGMFDVYSEAGEAHTVDLRQRVCDCRDFQYRRPDGGCKHVRRVLMLLGERPLPAGVDADPMLVRRRP